MRDTDSLMIISDDNDDSCLYIDENIFDSWTNQQQNKSTNTGNPFELDFFFLSSLNRFQTRSSQTILTSNTSLLQKRHRTTFCQAEYFATRMQETNTNDDNKIKEEEEEEQRIEVMKKQRSQTESLIISSSS
ncbi:hypothetical protein I4U23_028951 [Adineta vaga]|nr:hypothetical protein I4U23_028951 [Adineta vaga]